MGSTLSVQTSTATLFMIKSTVRTTRKLFFWRVTTPVIPCKGPRRILTVSPTVTLGCGSACTKCRPQRNLSMSSSGSGVGCRAVPTIERTPDNSRTPTRSLAGMCTNTYPGKRGLSSVTLQPLFQRRELTYSGRNNSILRSSRCSATRFSWLGLVYAAYQRRDGSGKTDFRSIFAVIRTKLRFRLLGEVIYALTSALPLYGSVRKGGRKGARSKIADINRTFKNLPNEYALYGSQPNPQGPRGIADNGRAQLVLNY